MEHMVQQQGATKSLRKREEGFGGNQGPAAFFQPAPLAIRQNPGPVISRSVADTSECSRTKDPGAPPEPLISIILSDTLAGMLLSQAILSLKLDQMTSTGNISGDGFDAYRKRFGDPVASRGKFKDRFDGTSHDTLASAQASEMNSLAKRLEKASSVLDKDINYYCLGGKAGGHGFSKCKPGDVLKSHTAENSIAICPDFWTTLTGQREIGIIHELFHIKYGYGDHDTAPFAQSAAERLSEPECYASFVADVNKVAPFDPSCPAVQPKLAINPPNDVYEQEADKVAEAVMSGSAGPIQRKCAACEEEEKVQRKCAHCEEEDKKIQRKEASDGSAAPSHTSVKQALQSGGQPLDGHTRSFMESRFGYDFSRVQIHDDPLAHRSSSEINALAYTHGNHIVFGAGKYRPETAAGKQLLAHELTHVVQQQSAVQTQLIQRAADDTHSLQSEELAGDPELEACAKGVVNSYLRMGSSGEPVARVQQGLEEIGFSLPEFGVDGKFGPETREAVIEYQDETELGTDGIVGILTIRALDTDLSSSCVCPTDDPDLVLQTNPDTDTVRRKGKKGKKKKKKCVNCGKKKPNVKPTPPAIPKPPKKPNLCPVLTPPLSGGTGADKHTFGEIGQFCIKSLHDCSAPPGLPDAKASIGATCARNTAARNCNSRDGSNTPATRPGDQHAWENIVHATGGRDLSNGANFMCVGSQNCGFVHLCTPIQHPGQPRPPQQSRAANLVPVATLSFNGTTLFFYSDPKLGNC
ncbi:MAG TPA: DUF4157 domain-containing protein [Puia sp.]